MLLVVGLNYQESHIGLREQYAPGASTQALTNRLLSLAWVAEAFVLATCNRTEIYCLLSPEMNMSLDSQPPTDFIAYKTELVHVWQTVLQIAPEVQSSLQPESVFFLWGRQSLKHLTQVAAGLEAMILGEPQILGQVKAAVQQSLDWGCLGGRFQRLLNPMFELAKLVRSNTAIGRCPVTFASATYQLASQIFTDLSQCHVLLIGAGEMIELVCRHFYHQGIRTISVANRTIGRTDRFVSQFSAKAYALDGLMDVLPQADIVVSCTGSTNRIVQVDLVKQALIHRRQKPIFLADLAVPRDICESIAKLENAFLYTVDDIHQVLDAYKGKRVAAAESAYRLIDDGLDQIVAQQRVQGSPWIQEYRSECEALRVQALAESRRQLMRGQDPYEVLENLSVSLTKRLIHKPTRGLRSLVAQGDPEQVDRVQQAFGLSLRKP